ncbi:MAG: hypothetical protein AB7U34_10805 [Novosphingobium sp.]
MQQPQYSFCETYSATKLIYRDIADCPTFSVDTGSFIDMTCFCLGGASYFEAALLNSKAMWFALKSTTTIASGGFFRMKSQYLEPLPIPFTSDVAKSELGKLAERAQAAAEKRYERQQAVTRRIPDIAPDPENVKLTTRLRYWWNAPSFAAFQKEVEKALKAKITLQERNEWESWIAETRAEINVLTAEIARLEAEINAKVYALFDLTPDEIALLEANI